MTRNKAITDYIDRFSIRLCIRRDQTRDLILDEMSDDIFGRCSDEIYFKMLRILKIFIVKDVADQFKFDTHSVF